MKLTLYLLFGSAFILVGIFALYVLFYPQLVAGPIERPGNLLPQFRARHEFDYLRVRDGLLRMAWGLVKKMVIADRVAVIVDQVYDAPTAYSGLPLVLATILFAVQIYCDFSGYSDIALGAASVMGFRLMENFRQPYFATSVADFWRRWHISLSSWFRDYLYIPLGGSRVGAPRRTFNLAVVFVLSGLWHGASWTFVIWGGLNGVFQVVSIATRGARERLAARIGPPAGICVLRSVLTFHLILVTWVFFRAASVSDATSILLRVAGSLPVLPGLLQTRLTSGEAIVALALNALLRGVEIVDERRSMWDRLAARPLSLRWAVYYGLLGGLVVLGVWNLQQFVYMQF